MKNGSLNGKWEDSSGRIEMSLQVLVFKEDKVTIAYLPALDLSGYGDSEKEALASLDIVLSEYFVYTTRKGSFTSDLKARGWKVTKKTKPFVAPELTTLFAENDYLQDIVNNKDYKAKMKPVQIPQYA